jgi:hypothetical protein
MTTDLCLERDLLLADRTLGALYYQDRRICWVLEDKVRPNGEKVPGQTAIPTGRYKLSISMSNRFKREMVLVHDVPGFEGIRIHGGNRPEDTEGCLLVARNRNSRAGTIQGTEEKMVFELVRRIIGAGETPYLIVSNPTNH